MNQSKTTDEIIIRREEKIIRNERIRQNYLDDIKNIQQTIDDDKELLKCFKRCLE